MRQAATHLLTLHIPRCAEHLTQRNAREYAQEQLAIDLHTFGVNVRLMGLVRQRLQNDGMKRACC